jgi:hypothetical protein
MTLPHEVVDGEVADMKFKILSIKTNSFETLTVA